MDTIDLKSYKVGFIGGGNMARAIGIPLIKKNILDSQNTWVSAKTKETLRIWEQIDPQHPVNTSLENYDVIINSDIIFLAVKPQVFLTAINSVREESKGRPLTLENKLFISVLVGITLKTLEHELKQFIDPRHPLKIIRTMPNMPLCVGEGVTVYSRNSQVSENDIKILVSMLSHISVVEEIPEYLMNAAGGLTASGPAYAYLIIEALADGAVKNGLPRDMATKFAAQVLIGAGKTVLQTRKNPGQLKDEVCSPGGTTITGIHALEVGAVRASLMNAVEAAVKRSSELGN
ncbi:pyrroline-5-carboxylate reductase [Chelonus insularis]|uniref:pyrroline-5-carboxylate reductase n=1 Tax=Chelonus insularis TaxID=460826 RepID=UPI00158F409B|nr:pyrroline-5-carboxylate reductase [Chelonus insularis]